MNFIAVTVITLKDNLANELRCSNYVIWRIIIYLNKSTQINHSFYKETYNRHLMYTMAAETFEHTSFFCAKINLELYFAPCKFKYIKLVTILNSTNTTQQYYQS